MQIKDLPIWTPWETEFEKNDLLKNTAANFVPI